MNRETLRRIFAEQGFDVNGASPHSWRCEYPDRYGGDCECVDEMIDAIMAEFPEREYVKSLTGATDEEIERLGGLNR